MSLRSTFRCTAVLAALVGVACNEPPLGAPASPRVTLTLQALPPGALAGTLSPPSVAFDGDSIIARSALSISGCDDYTPLGQAPKGILVLTIVASEAHRFCFPEGTAGSAAVAAHDLPPGVRDVWFTERFVRLDGSAHEIALAHARIDVP